MYYRVHWPGEGCLTDQFGLNIYPNMAFVTKIVGTVFCGFDIGFIEDRNLPGHGLPVDDLIELRQMPGEFTDFSSV